MVKMEKNKHTVDERVQDGHSTGRDTSVGVDLLEDCGLVSFA